MSCKTFFISILLLATSSVVYSQDNETTDAGDWLIFQTEIDTFYVVVDLDFENPIHVKGDSIQLEPGHHSLVMVHPEYRDVRSQLRIRENSRHQFAFSFSRKIGQDSTLSSYKRITKGLPHNITITSEPNSSIIIDDSTYGKGYVQADVGPFEHEIIIRHPTARDRSKKIYIDPSGQKELSIYTKPKVFSSFLLGFLPGASQFYKNQKIKGASITVATSIAIGIAGISHIKFRQRNDDYNSLETEYLRLDDEQEALELGNQVQQKYDEAKQAATIRDYTLATTLGIYIYSMIDAFASKPRSGYRLNIEPTTYFDSVNGQTAGLKIKINF